MDDLDEKLILLLRHNARLTISELAGSLGVSRATARARIAKLEREGTILSYTVVLRSDAFDMPVRGIMMIEIEGHVTEKVTKALRGLPEVLEVHTTNGRWDLVVELATGTLTDFDVVLRRIRLIPGITASETSLLLATPYSTRAQL